ncbi:MAG: thioesterase family protein [Bacteroidia bacterium]
MKDLRTRIPIQIRFNDIDLAGHVNNAIYITYFELARVAYINEFMGDVKIDWKEEGLILAKIEMNYKMPVFLEDTIVIETWVSRMGTKSLDMSCSIIKIEKGVETEVATGMAVIVCFNYKTNQTIVIPERWRNKIRK